MDSARFIDQTSLNQVLYSIQDGRNDVYFCITREKRIDIYTAKVEEMGDNCLFILLETVLELFSKIKFAKKKKTHLFVFT